MQYYSNTKVKYAIFQNQYLLKC